MDGPAHPASVTMACTLAVGALALLAPAGARAAVAPKITSGPSISGTPQVGSTLTASAAWSGDPKPDATWRWLRCAKTADNCAAIGAATANDYRATSDDVGAVLRVRLTVRNSAGSDQAVSAPTAVVTLAPAPSPTPTATPTPSPTPTATPMPSPTPTPTPTPTATPSPTPTPTPTATPTVVFAVTSPSSGGLALAVLPATSSPRALRPLDPFPVIRIRGLLTPQGARVTLLSVRAPRGVTIIVSCRGRDCPVRRLAAHVGRLRRFERALRAGTRIAITVIKSGFIGKRTVFVIRRGAAPARWDGCVDSDTRQVLRCPLG